VAPGPGKKADVVVRAEIEIPEQKVRASMSLRRRDNPAGPTVDIEIVFTLPADFVHGGIVIIPGIRMKEGEATPAVPLGAVGARVTANSFRVILVDGGSGSFQHLKEQAWLEIPVIYADNKRAIIGVEKGIFGERAFTEAFAAWGQ
jgi:hypothetical protein